MLQNGGGYIHPNKITFEESSQYGNDIVTALVAKYIYYIIYYLYYMLQ